jgi:hypothetical protein
VLPSGLPHFTCRFQKKNSANPKNLNKSIFFDFIYEKIENYGQKLSFTWYHKSIEYENINFKYMCVWKRGGAPQKQVCISSYSGEYTFCVSNVVQLSSAHTAFIGRDGSLYNFQ